MKTIPKITSMLLACRENPETIYTFKVPVKKVILYKEKFILCLHNHIERHGIIPRAFSISEFYTGMIVSYRPEKSKEKLIHETISRLDDISEETFENAINRNNKINFLKGGEK